MSTMNSAGPAKVRVEHADMLEAIPRLVAEGVMVDAVVCDPPYHLTATHKRFGAASSAPAQYGRDGAMARLSGGFMGKKWDGGDIAFRPETWATVATIMRPGAFLVAFGGTRTYHRLACAIEDAGFIIQENILDLISTDARVQRFMATLDAAQVDAFSAILDQMQPTGTLAWAFGSGFPKRRDMLKPAFEPICLAYKPGGARTMQIDECRIQTSDNRGGGMTSPGWGGPMHDGWCRPLHDDPDKMADRATIASDRVAKAEQLGRWPANLAHDGSDEVLACFPESASGPPRSRTGSRIRQSAFAMTDGNGGFGDSGSAARFFFSAKADKRDRWGSRHPTVKPVALMRWLVALVTPPGGMVLDPFAGSGTTGAAAIECGRNAILIEREEAYVADIRARLAFYEGNGTHSVAARNRAAQSAGALPLWETEDDR